MAYDDDSGSGTGRILWYEVGRSEGAASMRRNQEIQEARRWNAGVRTIDLKDIRLSSPIATSYGARLTTITMNSNWRTRKSSRRIRTSHS